MFNVRTFGLLLFTMILTACGGSSSTDSSTDDDDSSTGSALTISNENARFGFDHISDALYAKMSDLGGVWDRPHIGPAIWGELETSEGTFSWDDMDDAVRLSQQSGMNLMFSVFPYADWDQETCNDTLDSDLTSMFETLGEYRQQPCDIEKWKTFLKAMVERYDGDGVDDMESLVYPVKYWEIANEPAIAEVSEDAGVVFYSGTTSEYATLLTESFSAIREADSSAKIMHAGLFAVNDTTRTFWSSVFDEAGTDDFNIANYHSISDSSSDAQASSFMSFLSDEGIDKDVWMTELEFSEDAWGDQTAATAAQIVAKVYVEAFANGVDKIFMAGPSYDLSTGRSSEDNAFAILDSDGEETAVYTALKTLIAKIDEFSAVEEVATDIYKFTVGESDIYVSFTTGSLPSGIEGNQTITTLAGSSSTGTFADVPTDGDVYIVELVSSE